MKEKQDLKIKNRLKVILPILGVLYSIVILSLYLDWGTAYSIKLVWGLNISVALWFFFDFEMLRDDKFYSLSLLISILIILITYFIRVQFELDSFYTCLPSSMHAFGLLLVQWPLRRLFLLIFKVEPEYEEEIVSIGDMKNTIYTLILIFAIMILPILLWELVK